VLTYSNLDPCFLGEGGRMIEVGRKGNWNRGKDGWRGKERGRGMIGKG